MKKLAIALLLSGLAAAQQVPDAPQPNPQPQHTQAQTPQPQHRNWIARHKKASAVAGGVASAVAIYFATRSGHRQAAPFHCPGICAVHPLF